MKFGVTFPQTEIDPDPIAIRDYAQAAEGLGYSYLLAYDHILGANPNRPGGWAGRPYTFEHSFHEPLVLFGYLAGLTERLELVTGIIILPQRQTVLVAKQAAEVDVLSGGRLRLGVGVGWNEVEYEALGQDFGNRGRRAEEQVALLNELWTQELVKFRGHYHTVSDAGLNPLPVQRPIPLWFGGRAEVVLRRMARYGQGWMPNGSPDAQMARTLAQIHTYLAAEGRQPADFGVDGRISLGKPKAGWAAEVAAWRQLGATHLAVNTMGAGFTSLDEHLAAIREFWAEFGQGI